MGGDLYLGEQSTGVGTYNLGGTGVLLVGSDLIVGHSGTGTFNQSAGTATVTGALLIANNGGSTGTFNLTGGTFSAGPVVNNGTFNFTGGTASINSINGTGTTTVGSGRTLQVSHVRQNTLNVDGTVTVSANGTSTGVSKFASLNVGTSGVLDLKDNDAVIDYTGTSPIGTFSGGSYNGLQGKVAYAYHNSNWDRAGIKTSMTDADNGLTTLGIGEASQVLFLTGEL